MSPFQRAEETQGYRVAFAYGISHRHDSVGGTILPIFSRPGMDPAGICRANRESVSFALVLGWVYDNHS